MILCRGRNGCFKYGSFSVSSSAGDMFVEISSLRIGKNAPIILRGKREEIKDLFTEILEEIG